MSLRIFFCLFFLVTYGVAQEAPKSRAYTLDVSQFYGSILRHNPDISHLITSHPGGLILSYNRKTFGAKQWEQDFNYPDVGYSLIYQNLNNSILGENLGVYAHYNFYFLKRNLQFRLGQGIAYASNPYDRETNFRNNAYGSRILSSTYLSLNYHKEHIFKGLGVKAGIAVIHYSNANVRAPNTSTNTFAFNAGLVYSLNYNEAAQYIKNPKPERIKESLKYNLVFRSGINESDVIGSGQFPFYILSAYADKRLGRRSAIQLGADAFFSNFLKPLIEFQAVAFPELNVVRGTDYKRVGVFIGHELFVNKASILTQLGYYVYYPFDFEGRIYNRIGLKRYFGTKWFGAITLKSHGAKAEAVEFGLGIRL